MPPTAKLVVGRARPARYSRVWKMMRWFSDQNHLSSIIRWPLASTGWGSVYQ
jgi:hypothetical protein